MVTPVPIPAARSRYPALILYSMMAAHLFVLVVGIFIRFTDGDEGGMLTVSREVIGGRVPILEINAHNQPLMYYLYGGWMKLFGFSIVSARSLSMTVMFATGVILAWWVYRLTRNYLPTIFVYFLYITNLSYFKTNIPVKPFALSNFFTFAAFALISGRYMTQRTLTPAVLFLSGMLLGMSMGVRLIFTLPVAFAFWVIYVTWKHGIGPVEVVRKAAVFTAGVVIPVLPAIVIYIKEPLRAYTIWAGAYAQIYLGRGNNPDFMVDVHGGAKFAMILNGLGEVVRVPDMAILLLFLTVSTIVFLRSRRAHLDTFRREVYLFVWLVFGAILYVYTNLYGGYLGYVNQVVIYLIILGIPLAEAVCARVDVKKLVAGLAVFLALITAAFYVHYQKRLKTSIFYMFSSPDLIITPAFVDSVVKNDIEKLTKKDDIILDTWGAFVFASGRRPVRGFEYPTDNAFFWKLMPDKMRAEKYLYIPEPVLFRMIENQSIPLLVLGDPRELGFLLTGRYAPDDQEPLLRHAAKHYRLYKKYFVKPTNAWLLLYVPDGSGQPKRPEGGSG